MNGKIVNILAPLVLPVSPKKYANLDSFNQSLLCGSKEGNKMISQKD